MRKYESGNSGNEIELESTKGTSRWLAVLRDAWEQMTVEPLMLLHIFAHSSSEAVEENLFIDKSCLVTLQKPVEICDNLSSYKSDQTEVQRHSSKLVGASTFIENSVSFLLLFYLGPLSDRYGRKGFLIWSLLMEALKYGTLLLSSVFMYLPAELALVGPFFASLGMGMGGLQMLIYISVCDVTTSDNRTFRIGIVKIIMHIGLPLGVLYGGMIFSAFGYVVVFSTATFLYLVGLQYLLFMRETLPPEKRENDLPAGLQMRDVYRIPKDLIQATLGKDSSQRIIAMISLFNFFVASMCLKPPYYLFSRLMFDWDATQYSYWASYKDFAGGAAMIILVPILVGHLKLRDAAIGMTGGGSAVFMFVLLGQIRHSDMLWLMIIAPLIGLWMPGAYVALRAIWSKMATRPQELGKLFAAQTIIGVAGEAVSGPIYSAFYNATLYSLQGASFLLCAIFFTLVVFGIRFCEVFIQRREMKTVHWISS